MDDGYLVISDYGINWILWQTLVIMVMVNDYSKLVITVKMANCGHNW